MPTEVKTDDIILAAIAAAGPAPTRGSRGSGNAAWVARVREMAGEITLMLDPDGAMYKHVAQYKLVDKPFVAVILGGKVEASTGRAIVRLVADRDGAEEEALRTHHLNTPDGKRVWEEAKSLKGRRVLVFKLLEEKDGRKYRVLQHLRDLGEPRTAAEDAAAPDGA